MKITCISDTHRKFPIPDKGGDIFIHAGDFSLHARYFRQEFLILYPEFDRFKQYLRQVRKKFKHVLFIPGNHDLIVESFEKKVRDELDEAKVTTLINEDVTINGVKFWGSPITPKFRDWAYEKPGMHREMLWETIPDDTDVLVTHTPAQGILDRCPSGNVGCVHLTNRINMLSPKVHICGHIHESHGHVKMAGVDHYNVSHMDGLYQPANDFTVFRI